MFNGQITILIFLSCWIRAIHKKIIKKHIRKKNENSVVVNIRMVEAQLPIAVAVFFVLRHSIDECSMEDPVKKFLEISPEA